eukprot:COSAG01_NODE_4144_length_5300_cov_3.103057_7_plen_132_part_00
MAGVLTEIYLCGVCSCQEMLRRNGRGQADDTDDLESVGRAKGRGGREGRRGAAAAVDGDDGDDDDDETLAQKQAQLLLQKKKLELMKARVSVPPPRPCLALLRRRLATRVCLIEAPWLATSGHGVSIIPAF